MPSWTWAVVLLTVGLWATCQTLQADWKQFRGPQGAGVAAAGQDLPSLWDRVTGENIAWKAELPGRGLSAPVVVGGKVILTACSGPRQDRLHVLAFDKKSGKQLWHRQFWSTGRTMCHRKTNVAAPTPVADENAIYAFYSTNDVVCLSLDGRLRWLRGLTFDYPNASNSLGMASSPVATENTLILQLENDSESFAIGLNKQTGENRWKIDRPRMANWTSPVLLPVNPDSLGPVVLLQSSQGLAAYEADTGKALWEFSEGASTIPSTAVGGGLVFVPSDGLTALRPSLDRRGQPEKLWSDNRLAPSTPSPAVYQGRIYTVNRSGVLRCASAEDGELLWQLRLEGRFSSTPVIADHRLYLFNEEGLGHVVDLRPDVDTKERIVGQNDLAEEILCTPAISDKAMFVRSNQHLWKISRSE